MRRSPAIRDISAGSSTWASAGPGRARTHHEPVTLESTGMHAALRMLAILVLLTPCAAAAQQDVRPHIGTVIIAHGGGPEWNAQVEHVAELVETGGPVEVSYLMGPGAKTHRFQDAVARLVAAGASRVVVVPVLMSSHSGHYEQIRYLAGEVDELSEVMMHHLQMAGIERPTTSVPVYVARAIDDSPDVARVLAERALALTDDPASHALFILGHGPNSAEDNAMWMQN